MRKLTTEEFIRKAKEIHEEKYDYSLVDYVNARTKVEIVCKKHGSFWQLPHNHLKGKGCVHCAGLGKPTTNEFINQAKKVHGGEV